MRNSGIHMRSFTASLEVGSCPFRSRTTTLKQEMLAPPKALYIRAMPQTRQMILCLRVLLDGAHQELCMSALRQKGKRRNRMALLRSMGKMIVSRSQKCSLQIQSMGMRETKILSKHHCHALRTMIMRRISNHQVSLRQLLHLHNFNSPAYAKLEATTPGFLSIVKPHPTIKLLTTKYHNWSPILGI